MRKVNEAVIVSLFLVLSTPSNLFAQFNKIQKTSGVFLYEHFHLINVDEALRPAGFIYGSKKINSDTYDRGVFFLFDGIDHFSGSFKNNFPVIDSQSVLKASRECFDSWINRPKKLIKTNCEQYEYSRVYMEMEYSHVGEFTIETPNFGECRKYVCQKIPVYIITKVVEFKVL